MTVPTAVPTTVPTAVPSGGQAGDPAGDTPSDVPPGRDPAAITSALDLLRLIHHRPAPYGGPGHGPAGARRDPENR
ncbi:hypothetical protein [Streptomyces sp. NPDC017435]|uniref:hypothetical protein n=1 Tax=Streptomyces sp. NPDC017435 TaxID=3364995 RepID=UPI003796ADEA